ncbi:MAG TPA: phosphatase PAP2 family protein [Gemmatimonadales bacterium]
MALKRGVTPTDKLFLAYLAINSCVLAWHAHEVEGWPWLVLGNLLALLLVWLLARAPRSAVVDFLGGAYPIILTAAYYTQLGEINIDVGRLFDRTVQHWEVGLFGGEVSVTWHQRMPNLTLSFILHFCYASYYWLLCLPPLFLFFRRSRDAFERAGFIMTLGFYVCFLIFSLFPVAGPRYFFGNATGPIAQVATARFERWLSEGGSAIGTAFPSSHVAATWCAVYSLWRDARWLALLVAPVAIGLALGTVFGQFHYGVDALAGALLGVALCAAADPMRAVLARSAPSSS